MKHIIYSELSVFRLALSNVMLILILIAPLSLRSQQQDTLSLDKYKQADKLRWDNVSQNVYGLNIIPHWKSDNSGFWFTDHSDEGVRYNQLSYSDMKVLEIFDHDALSKNLNQNFNHNTKPDELGLNDLNFISKHVVTFNLDGAKYSYEINNDKLNPKLLIPPSSDMEAASPNGKWIAFTRDYNLYVRLRDGSGEIQLSTAGKENYEYASRYGWFDKMEGEEGKRPERFSIQWSPDSKKIFCNIVDLSNASKMYMLDNSVDSLYRPRLQSYFRGSPGDTNIVYYKPVVFDIETECETQIQIKPVPHFIGVYPTWKEDGSKLYLTHWERGFLKASISEVNLEDGMMSDLYVENSEIGIEYSSFVPFYSEKNNQFIFTSEASGWKQLYSLNLKNNKVNRITAGQYFINAVEHIDEENKVIYFTASGNEPGANPYHQYLYRVDFDGSNLNLLTPEHGHHNVSISKDGNYFIDNISSHSDPTKSVLRETKVGSVVAKISEANTTYLDNLGWRPPLMFSVKAEDDTTDIYGVIYRPTDFDSTKSYPIIDATYTGPHTSRFPKSYYSTIRSNSPAIAELGFVIIRVDGRGSNNRSKQFRSYSYKNLGGGLDDHVVAIKSLGKKFSWIDTNRVGVFGHSAGGYDAGRALLAYPDFYKVGVASSADHDHRMEKAWWPEMYMGWPVGDEYHDQSNVTNAKNLKGKLLLIHGALDDNVNISATLKLSEALIKADKEFDLLIFPSQRHGYSGKHKAYFAKKRWNYFVEHLLRKTPRWNYDLN